MAFAPNGIPEAPRTGALKQPDLSASGDQPGSLSWLKQYTSTGSTATNGVTTDTASLPDKPASPASPAITQDALAGVIKNGGSDAARDLVDGATGAQAGGQAGSEIGLGDQMVAKLTKKEEVPDDDEVQKPDDDLPLLPAAEVAGGLLAARHFAHHHHFIRRMWKAFKLFVKKWALRGEKLWEKLKQKRLLKKEDKAKTTADEAKLEHDRKKKLADDAKEKGAKPNAAEDDLRASREADLALERAAKRSAAADRALLEAGDATRASRVRGANIESDLDLAKSASRRNIIALFAVPIVATAAVIYYRKPGEGLMTTLGRAKNTFVNWSINSFVPENVQKVYNENGFGAAFKQLGTDAEGLAERTGAFFQLAANDPNAALDKGFDMAKTATRDIVKGIDWFVNTDTDTKRHYLETGGEVIAEAADDPNITGAVGNTLVTGGTPDTAQQALLAVTQNHKIMGDLKALNLGDPPAPVETSGKKPSVSGDDPRDHIIHAQHPADNRPDTGG